MTSRMRILHTAESYPPLVSGVPEVVRQISERLASRGHEVHVATQAISGAPRIEERNGVHVHRFHLSGNHLCGIKGRPQPYLELVQQGRWDIIATHCAQVWCTDLLFNLPLAAPLIFVAHGLSAYKDSWQKSYFDRLASWLHDDKQMVSLSSTGLEDAPFCQQYQLPRPTIIPNGVDLELWSTPPLGVRKHWGHQQHPWLLNVSTHTHAKAHSRLFELMRLLQRSHPNIHLTQIGNSHPARRWGLGRLGIQGECFHSCRARALLTHSLDLKLNVSREQTISAIKEADIVVLTSKWEASPLMILESMAAGTPFVSFDVGCVREHAGGLVVQSMAEMTDAVRSLQSPELRADLGRQGRQRIADKHDWKNTVDQYEALYRQTASRTVLAEEAACASC